MQFYRVRWHIFAYIASEPLNLIWRALMRKNHSSANINFSLTTRVMCECDRVTHKIVVSHIILWGIRIAGYIIIKRYLILQKLKYCPFLLFYVDSLSDNKDLCIYSLLNIINKYTKTCSINFRLIPNCMMKAKSVHRRPFIRDWIIRLYQILYGFWCV